MSLGVVVVGLGRAGQARVRDIAKTSQYVPAFPCLEGVHLVGHVSRRDVAVEGSTALVLEEALKRSDVNIIVICTENVLHEKTARYKIMDVVYSQILLKWAPDSRGGQCLEAGKHVLVEYPLTLTSEAYTELTQLANSKGVVYREEDIALYTEDFQRVQDFAKDRTLEEAEVTQLGSYNGWIEDPASGPPYLCSVHLLHVYLSLFGDLTPADAYIIQEENKFTAFGHLKTAAGKSVKINISMEKREPFRKKTYTYRFTDGSTLQEVPPKGPPSAPTPPDKPGLFMKDFISFVDNVKNGVERSPSAWITERAIKLANDLFDLAKKSPQSSGL